MKENSIHTIIVNPRNDRLYNYWINGTLEKRSMMKERMRKFCLDLSPKNAEQINRCINEIIPFVVFVDRDEFQELEDQAPESIPKAKRVFPLRQKVYSKRDFSLAKKPSVVEEQSKRFNIWEKFNIHIDQQKNSKESLFKGRKL